MYHIKLVSPVFTYSKLQPGISNSQLISKILHFNKTSHVFIDRCIMQKLKARADMLSYQSIDCIKVTNFILVWGCTFEDKPANIS